MRIIIVEQLGVVAFGESVQDEKGALERLLKFGRILRRFEPVRHTVIVVWGPVGFLYSECRGTRLRVGFNYPHPSEIRQLPCPRLGSWKNWRNRPGWRW